jgi:hypothetical protein
MTIILLESQKKEMVCCQQESRESVLPESRVSAVTVRNLKLFPEEYFVQGRIGDILALMGTWKMG